MESQLRVTHMTMQEYHDYLQSDEAPNATRQQRECDELVLQKQEEGTV